MQAVALVRISKSTKSTVSKPEGVLDGMRVPTLFIRLSNVITINLQIINVVMTLCADRVYNNNKKFIKTEVNYNS